MLKVTVAFELLPFPQSLQRSILPDGLFAGMIVLPAAFSTLKTQHCLPAVCLKHVDNSTERTLVACI